MSGKLYNYVNRYGRYCVRARINGVQFTFGWCDHEEDAIMLAATVRLYQATRKSIDEKKKASYKKNKG